MQKWSPEPCTEVGLTIEVRLWVTLAAGAPLVAAQYSFVTSRSANLRDVGDTQADARPPPEKTKREKEEEGGKREEGGEKRKRRPSGPSG